MPFEMKKKEDHLAIIQSKKIKTKITMMATTTKTKIKKQVRQCRLIDIVLRLYKGCGGWCGSLVFAALFARLFASGRMETDALMEAESTMQKYRETIKKEHDFPSGIRNMPEAGFEPATFRL